MQAVYHHFTLFCPLSPTSPHFNSHNCIEKKDRSSDRSDRTANSLNSAQARRVLSYTLSYDTDLINTQFNNIAFFQVFGRIESHANAGGCSR